MAGVNKVILVGNLGQDPETNYTADGKAITRVSIATSDEWKDKNTGEKKSKTEWHRVVMFGKLAEIAKQYLRKGSKIYVEGQLRTNKWQDKSGQDRYTTEVVIQGFNGVMQMLDSRTGGSQDFDQSTSPQQSQNQGQQPPQQQQQQQNKPAPMVEDDFDDDIPF